jgi:predicted DNA-binding WGR domain protein
MAAFVLKSNIRMIKLYLKTKSVMRYHEAWISGSKVVEHWGVVGDRGESQEHKKDRKKSDEENILDVLADPLAKGFLPIDDDGFDVLIIEYAIDGMGNKKDLKKRHDLEDRMNETLGWTGLGNCDGGSTGSGTMEVCCFVVDFKTAKRVIAKDLSESKFSDFKRIYAEK